MVAIMVAFLSLAGHAATKTITVGKLKYSVNTSTKNARLLGRAEKTTKTWDLTIPDEITTDLGTFKVVAVEKSAFYMDSYIRNVTVGNNVVDICESSFGASTVSSVTFDVFHSACATIGEEAFHNTLITKLTLPRSITTIRKKAFMSCQKLKSLTLGDQLKYIQPSAFSNCCSLTTVKIPGTVKSIGENAFADCTSLTTVEFQQGLGGTIVETRAFNNNQSITTVRCYSPGVVSFGDGAFVNNHISYLSLPTTLKTIGNYAFSLNDIATPVSFPEGLTTIGHAAFSDQGLLPPDGWGTIVIPSTVTEIGYDAFHNVGDVHTVISKAVIPPTCTVQHARYAFEPETMSDARLIVPAGSEDLYREAGTWKDFRWWKTPEADADDVTDDARASDDMGQEDVYYFDLNGSAVDASALTPGIYIRRQGGHASKFMVHN